MAPLLTPQTWVTQTLSSAYSHPAYPLGVWGGGGAGPIPGRLEPLSHRELLFSLVETVGVPSGSCLRALLGASVSAHLNPTCVRACVCVCVCALVHAYICTPPCPATPPSAVSGLTLIAPLTLRLTGGTNPTAFILRSRLPVQAEAPGGRRSAGAPLFHCIHSLVLGARPRTLLLQVIGSKPLLPGPSLLSPPDATKVLSPLGQTLTLCPQTTGLYCQLF